MELVFNELSLLPLANNLPDFEDRIDKFIRAFKEAKTKFEFTHIRFPQDYSSLQATSEKSFYEGILFLKNSVLKTLALGLFKSPYTDDLVEDEMAELFSSKYVVKDCSITKEPFGLVVANIKSTPAISINSSDFWRENILIVTATNATSSFDLLCFNIFRNECLESKEIQDWNQNFLYKRIDSEPTLVKYLNFNNYTISFSNTFFTELMEWRKNEYDVYKRILTLMKNVETNPFTGGIGKTENLSNRNKEASKRITLVDRLSYEVDNDNVHFILCKGHYSHH